MSHSLIDIGQLIAVDLDRHGGRPVIARTGTSVRQIVALYRQVIVPTLVIFDHSSLGSIRC
jgi:uncharacterized protein (DUF433 family)